VKIIIRGQVEAKSHGAGMFRQKEESLEMSIRRLSVSLRKLEGTVLICHRRSRDRGKNSQARSLG